MTTDDRTGTGSDLGPGQASHRPPDAAPTIRHVLVPLDGSTASEQAIPYAAAVARRTGARLTLAHVREDADARDGVAAEYPAPLLGDPQLALAPDAAAEVLHGSPRDALLAFVDAARADLVVMTSRGRGGIRRALFGSVADGIVRGAELPVLVVKPRDDEPVELEPPADEPRGGEPRGGEPRDARSRAPARPLLRVLLPLDGSEMAERIVPYALALTGTADVHYVLLRVHPALTPDGRLEPGPILGVRPDHADDGYLSTTSARIADLGVLVSSRSLTHASNADVIVRMVEEDDVDLVAMTTRGAGGADRMLFGSVADEVVRRAPCHVLLLRPPSDALPPPLDAADARTHDARTHDARTHDAPERAARPDPWATLARVRATAPLVHNITNYVVMNSTANALLAVGASPAMVHAVEEVEDFTAISQALVVNIGTLSAPWVAAMRLAAARARAGAIPWVLDPVGAGATPYRTGIAVELARLAPTVIRGNASEILVLAAAIAGEGGTAAAGKGVDSTHAAGDAIEPARRLARSTGSLVAMTGAVDYVTDGARVAAIDNGDAMMTRVTGLGCTASALVAAFLAAADGDPFAATVAALAVLGVAGEMAAEGAAGPGSLQLRLLDALHTLDEPTLRARARIEDAG